MLGHLIPWSAAISDLGLRRPTEDPPSVITVPTLKLAVTSRFAARGRPLAALVVGNPTKDLVFAKAEARDVAARFGTHAILEEQATKAAVLGRLESADVVHLATHAFLATGNPMDSGIRLADGVLTAREVMQLRLQADLLVLSACETGLGTSLGGDELGGLSRAFIYAGVRSMIVSLWKVDDMATAALMTAFYDAYCDGADKAEALSQAMAHVRAREKWQHLFYWGAFVLMGEWN
jgi:CHAT domain-containing protein